MKRRDLEVGRAYAAWAPNNDYGRTRADKVVVMTTDPWVEDRTYMGRFGWGKTGRLHPAHRDRGDHANGVAVLALRGWNIERAQWEPEVVPLGHIQQPWEEYEADRAVARANDARLNNAKQERQRRFNVMNGILAGHGRGPVHASFDVTTVDVPFSLFDEMMRLCYPNEMVQSGIGGERTR